jgi:hypothetical protein
VRKLGVLKAESAFRLLFKFNVRNRKNLQVFRWKCYFLKKFWWLHATLFDLLIFQLRHKMFNINLNRNCTKNVACVQKRAVTLDVCRGT